MRTFCFLESLKVTVFLLHFPPPPRKFNGATRNVPQTWKFCDTRITNITNITSSSLEKNQ